MMSKTYWNHRQNVRGWPAAQLTWLKDQKEYGSHNMNVQNIHTSKHECVRYDFRTGLNVAGWLCESFPLTRWACWEPVESSHGVLCYDPQVGSDETLFKAEVTRLGALRQLGYRALRKWWYRGALQRYLVFTVSKSERSLLSLLQNHHFWTWKPFANPNGPESYGTSCQSLVLVDAFLWVPSFAMYSKATLIAVIGLWQLVNREDCKHIESRHPFLLTRLMGCDRRRTWDDTLGGPEWSIWGMNVGLQFNQVDVRSATLWSLWTPTVWWFVCSFSIRYFQTQFFSLHSLHSLVRVLAIGWRAMPQTLRAHWCQHCSKRSPGSQVFLNGWWIPRQNMGHPNTSTVIFGRRVCKCRLHSDTQWHTHRDHKRTQLWALDSWRSGMKPLRLMALHCQPVLLLKYADICWQLTWWHWILLEGGIDW